MRRVQRLEQFDVSAQCKKYRNYVKIKTSTKSGICDILEQDGRSKELTDHCDKAEGFNKYFSRVFPVESQGVLPQTKTAMNLW